MPTDDEIRADDARRLAEVRERMMGLLDILEPDPEQREKYQANIDKRFPPLKKNEPPPPEKA